MQDRTRVTVGKANQPDLDRSSRFRRASACCRGWGVLMESPPAPDRDVEWHSMAYDVSTPVFEGPFDLLLHLILREQVDIYEVSLATIVNAYLIEVEKLQSIDLDLATEFLLIASTLV